MAIFKSAILSRKLVAKVNAYIWLTNLLGFPQNDSKNCQETMVTVFGIEIDIFSFRARTLQEKFEKPVRASLKVLS